MILSKEALEELGMFEVEVLQPMDGNMLLICIPFDYPFDATEVKKKLES